MELNYTQLSKEYNINYATLKYRISRGYTLEQAVKKKLQRQGVKPMTPQRLRQKTHYYMRYHNIKWGDFSHLPEYWWDEKDLIAINKSNGIQNLSNM